MIGDSENDVIAGETAGCKECILVEKNKGNELLTIIERILES
jgi:phosphoglycolate phosphatase-like HAD superfamily hydrolase